MTDKEFKELFTKSEELTPRAELKCEILKKATAETSAQANNTEKRASKHLSFRKAFAPIAACFVLAVISVIVFFGLKGENYQTVYIDVNPSVELQINRFGKVSNVIYVNEDAEIALSEVKLKGKSAEAALEKIIGAYDESGYFNEDAELYISAIDKNQKTEKLLEKLSEHAEKIKGSKKYTVNVSKLSKEDKVTAKEYGISPGKYKVISAVMEEHPEYTIDELKDKSMAYLKDLLSQSDDKHDNPNKQDKPDKDNKK